MAQVPAIILEVVFPWDDVGYADMIFVEAVVNDNGYSSISCIVACWDWNDDVPTEWKGKYDHCYDDDRADWYKQHGAWRGS
jgi:hypothetical protein